MEPFPKIDLEGLGLAITESYYGYLDAEPHSAEEAEFLSQTDLYIGQYRAEFERRNGLVNMDFPEVKCKRFEMLGSFMLAETINRMVVRPPFIFTQSDDRRPLYYRVGGNDTVEVLYWNVSHKTLPSDQEDRGPYYRGLVMAGYFYIPTRRVNEEGEPLYNLVGGIAPCPATEIILPSVRNN